MKALTKTSIMLLMAGIALTGCNKKEPAQQVKSNGLPKAEAKAATAAGCGVAVVDIDSLATKCDYCKDGLKALESKQNSFRSQLNAKGQALQKAMADFQNKAQHGGFTSQQQVEKAQANLQKQQQGLQSFQAKIENEMAAATDAYQKKLREDLDAFIKEYNADGRYKMIVSKTGDNVLYADPSVDITNDVVDGLNKIYKSSKKK